MKDLKEKTIRGGLAKAVAQATNFALRLVSLMILARLLDPKDFGLVGMVTAIIGVFNVFKDFGLSAAAVQHKAITEEQSSTLFWLNLLVGATLAVIVISISPVVAAFYHEPRLFGVTIALASGFVFNAAGVQQCAHLEREMRFTTLSIIDIISLVVSTAVGISMALRGYGYWSLVATTILSPFTYTACVWWAARWIPGRPRRGVGVLSLMRFGGTLTLNGLVMYCASNFEKVLLGRFWGAEAIGIYGRAYQLISIPTDNLNSSAGGVAFAALSRLQDEPARFKSYFLKGYSLVLSLTVPIAVACAVFGSDMIAVFLGAKWKEAAPVFRLLAPTTLAFAILNPLGWLMSSLGLVGRGLKIALVLAPVMITGYVLGLPYGPRGVALAYSSVMTMCVLPLMAWAVHGTAVSMSDVLRTASRPLISGLVAAAAALVLAYLLGTNNTALIRLAIGSVVLFGVYTGMLLYIMRQKSFYVELIHTFLKRAPEEEVLASA